MMEPGDEVFLSEATPLSTSIEEDIQYSNPSERRMIFHCRPDLSGRRLLFQDRNSSINERERQQTAPAQLLTIDGRSYLGLPLAKSTSNTASNSPFYLDQDDDKLARVSTLVNPGEHITI
ncbi:unnamed protein product [Phytophthora fragariaefolia]|uniref:Unnamed protein product n=1 Tax=Phytophthora fragariaefolia TaxID=1490495 RepID=A0A9W6YAL5_9STRA|nr:unnamed protein product [Phytophthora fragariaefolia]